MSLHNLVIKEVYRVTYHFLLLKVVMVDCFSIDFHFNKLCNLYFFGIRSVSYVNFSSDIMQSPIKLSLRPNSASLVKFVIR